MSVKQASNVPTREDEVCKWSCGCKKMVLMVKGRGKEKLFAHFSPEISDLFQSSTFLSLSRAGRSKHGLKVCPQKTLVRLLPVAQQVPVKETLD